MQDAIINRLVKTLTEPESDEKLKKNGPSPERRSFLSRLYLAEGWSSLFLLALVVYSTIWCVQAAGWVNHLDVLTPIPALGLIFGVIAAKQRRIPRVPMHLLAVGLSILIAFWQTSSADYTGQTAALLANIHTWLLLAVNGGASSDDSIFLFLILALGFLLAYTSSWLVYRTRSPWLMLLANAVILLINLSYIDANYVFLLVVFLMAALLLLLSFNFYEFSLGWKRLGLRRSDNLNWEFMQAGVLISLAILVLPWFLPSGYINQQAAQIWSADDNPWVLVQNSWNRLLAVGNGAILPNHGSFANTLTLSGNPNLTNTPVFQVKTSDGSQYLLSISYDQYDGSRSWSNSPQSLVATQVNVPSYDGSADLHSVTQTITVLNPPGEEYPYLFGASQIASSDQSTHLQENASDSEVVARLRDKGKLVADDVYTVVSYVSDADVQSLRTVPIPSASTQQLPSHDEANLPLTYFNPNVLATYTKLPANLSPRIKALAIQITRNAPTLYDKVTALETYLRNYYIYDSTITAPPSGDEAISWFLFTSKRGFCNYFASAMALMARELGIPARLVVGYTNGKADSQAGVQVIDGTDAHAWTQVYFAGYGWINFEPSASFLVFTRPTVAPSNTSGGSTTPSGTTNPNKKPTGRKSPSQNDGSSLSSGSTGPSDLAGQLRLDTSVVLLVLLILVLGGLLGLRFWWRRIFRGLSLPSQIYGRVCILAEWAGISPKSWQTPHEHMQALATVAPEEAVTLERLGDIYVRERWADPQSLDHPSQSGEISEIPDLWKSLQPRLITYVLHHPYFLKHIPGQLRHLTHRLPFRRAPFNAPRTVVDEDLT